MIRWTEFVAPYWPKKNCRIVRLCWAYQHSVPYVHGHSLNHGSPTMSLDVRLQHYFLRENYLHVEFLAQALRLQGLCNPEGVFETPEYITLKPLKHSA